jgi:hypothetical protein
MDNIHPTFRDCAEARQKCREDLFREIGRKMSFKFVTIISSVAIVAIIGSYTVGWTAHAKMDTFKENYHVPTQIEALTTTINDLKSDVKELRDEVHDIQTTLATMSD